MSDDKVVVAQHLCLTEEGCCVVPETSPYARWLKWATGTEVSKAEYERLTNCQKHNPKPVPPKKQAAPRKR